MQDLLQEVIEEQKSSLEKYKNHNVRTKNAKFFPFTEKENSESIDMTQKLKKSKEAEVKSKEVSGASDLENFLIGLSKKYNNDTELQKKQEQTYLFKRKNLAERNKVIINSYLYLFDSMYKYSLCFEEFKDIVSKFPQFLKSIPEIKTKPKSVDVRNFVYKIRTVSLIQKINIFAYQIGQYNFSLLVNELKNIDVFSDYAPEDLAIIVSKKYKGTDLDYEALLTLNEVAEADMGGKIVFEKEEISTPKKTESIKPIEKKEQRKKSLGFGSFNLKSKH